MKSVNNISFPIVVETDEDGVYIVSCPLFKGCHSYGSSIDEAIHNLSEVIEICLDEESDISGYLQNYVGIREVNFNDMKKANLQNA